MPWRRPACNAASTASKRPTTPTAGRTPFPTSSTKRWTWPRRRSATAWAAAPHRCRRHDYAADDAPERRALDRLVPFAPPAVDAVPEAGGGHIGRDALGSVDLHPARFDRCADIRRRPRAFAGFDAIQHVEGVGD